MTTPNDPYSSGGSDYPPDPFAPLGEGTASSSTEDLSTEGGGAHSGGTYGDAGSTGTSGGTYSGTGSTGGIYSGGETYTETYTETTSDGGSTTDTAKEQAQQVKESAGQATAQVASTAKEQAQQVTSDVRQQARQLAGETKSQLSTQATSQRDKAVSQLRSVAEEFGSMSQNSEQSGLGAQLAQEGSRITHQVADFLEQREPTQLLDEVRNFARRRPGVFLAGAAFAGVAVGRLTRGAVSARSSDSSSYDGGEFATGYSPVGVSRPTPGPYYGGTQGDALDYEGTTMSGRGTATTGTATTAGGLQSPPILDEPYGEQSPPSGYSSGSGGIS